MNMEDRFVYAGNPVAKPRMTRADAWKKRPIVLAYWEFKDDINKQAKEQKFTISESFRVRFNVEMPKSWSKKKKKEMNGKPHKARPDIDNYLKSLQDSLLHEDSAVHYVVASKKWSYNGSIVVDNFPEDLDF